MARSRADFVTTAVSQQWTFSYFYKGERGGISFTVHLDSIIVDAFFISETYFQMENQIISVIQTYQLNQNDESSDKYCKRCNKPIKNTSSPKSQSKKAIQQRDLLNYIYQTSSNRKLTWAQDLNNSDFHFRLNYSQNYKYHQPQNFYLRKLYFATLSLINKLAYNFKL